MNDNDNDDYCYTNCQDYTASDYEAGVRICAGCGRPKPRRRSTE